MLHLHRFIVIDNEATFGNTLSNFLMAINIMR